MLKETVSNYRGLKLFNVITVLMIGIMLYYIGAKLTSLVVSGDTRQVLVMETKDFLTHKIKAAICNEILISDEYLTEDRLIRLTDIQNSKYKQSKEDKKIDEYMLKLESYKTNIELALSELKEDININFNMENKEIKELGAMSKDEEKLLSYNSSQQELQTNIGIINTLNENNDYKYMLNKFFTVDGKTSIDKNIFKTKELLKVENTIKKDKTKPQILIYHTHSSETYANSRKGKKEDTIVGVGAYLHDLLVERYGFNVIHNTSSYDVINGRWNRNSYETALVDLEKIIRDNPSIELVIDLHRDSGKTKTATNINGIKVAKIMFFNGVSRSNVANRADLPNESLKNNIAFSLSMQMKSMSLYRDFSKKIYLKGYRYNQHVAKKCMLVEVGNNKNTVEEAKRAMILYAKILNGVIGQ